MTLLTITLLSCRHSPSVPSPEFIEPPVCTVSQVERFLGGTNSQSQFGVGVSLLAAGTGTLAMNENRFAAVGSPNSVGGGSVEIVKLDTLSGGVDTTATSTLLSETTASDFGYVLSSGDFKHCYDPGTSIQENACGQELIVGAPDFEGLSPGSAYLYEPVNDGFGYYDWVADILPPIGTPNGAEFGASLAHYSYLPDPDTPWEPAESDTDWLAVGAPGVGRVYLFSVNNSSTSNPISNPPLVIDPILIFGTEFAGKGFGHSLVAGDFDDDGIGDLAIGAPDDNSTEPAGTTNGKVVVFYNVSTSAFNSSNHEILQDDVNAGLTSVEADLFGYALAAGKLYGEQSGDALAVGSPGRYPGSGPAAIWGAYGEVHSFRLDGASPLRESGSITLGSWKYRAQYGSSLSIENAINMDGTSSQISEMAALPELIVGAPGYDFGQGAVLIHKTDGAKVQFSVISETVTASTHSTGSAPSSSYNLRFGESMSTGYVQSTFWGDLLIGEPGALGATGVPDGSATLTQSQDIVAVPSALQQTYVMTDGFGVEVNGIAYEDSNTGNTIIQIGEQYSFAIEALASLPSTTTPYCGMFDSEQYEFNEAALADDPDVEDLDPFCAPLTELYLAEGTNIDLGGVLSLSTCGSPQTFGFNVMTVVDPQLDALERSGDITEDQRDTITNSINILPNVSMEVDFCDFSLTTSGKDELEVDFANPTALLVATGAIDAAVRKQYTKERKDAGDPVSLDDCFDYTTCELTGVPIHMESNEGICE